jgi:hypothetical protein
VGQLEFREWTSGGHLPHSKFVGLRSHKRAKVRRDMPSWDLILASGLLAWAFLCRYLRRSVATLTPSDKRQFRKCEGRLGLFLRVAGFGIGIHFQ